MLDWQSYLASVDTYYSAKLKANTLLNWRMHPVVGERQIADLSAAHIRATVQPIGKQDRINAPDQEQWAVPNQPRVLDDKFFQSRSVSVKRESPRRMLLLGAPGAGKSTALAKLLLAQVNQCRQTLKQGYISAIPVIIQLRHCQTSIEELVHRTLQHHNLKLPLSETRQLIQEGQLFLLIDDIDEAPSQSVKETLQFLGKGIYRSSVVYTARNLDLGYTLDPIKFWTCKILPLGKSELQRFVDHYCPETGTSLINQWPEYLYRFGQSSCLVKMLCALFLATETVPPTLGLLFQQVLKCYEVGLQSLGLRLPQQAVLMLERLALTMAQGHCSTILRRAMPEAEAIDCLATAGGIEDTTQPLGQGEIWLKYLLDHHLIQIADIDAHIEFCHPLVQDYYIALGFLKQLEAIDADHFQEQYFHYPKWIQPLQLMVGLLEDEQQVIKIVKLAMQTDLDLAAKLTQAVDLKWHPQIFDQLNQVTQSVEARVRFWHGTGSSQAMPMLIAALKSPEAEIRWRTIVALEAIEAKTAIPEICLMLSDSDCFVRRRAAKTLGIIGDETVIPCLLAALDDADLDVFTLAAASLKQLGYKAGVPHMIKALDHKSLDRRDRAKSQLLKIGSRAAVLALLKTLKTDDYAARNLREIVAEASVPDLLAVVEGTIPFPDDSRKAAIRLLGKLNAKAALPTLLRTLQDKDLQRESCLALGEIGSEAAVPILLQLLKNSPHQQGYIAQALGEIGSEAAVPALLELLENTDESFAIQQVTKALGHIGSEEAIPDLVRVLKGQHGPPRRQTTPSPGPQVFGRITAWYNIYDNDDDVYDRQSRVSCKEAAAEALGEFDSATVVPILIEHMHWDMRRSIERVLKKMGPEQVGPILLKALDDPDHRIREQTAKALGVCSRIR